MTSTDYVPPTTDADDDDNLGWDQNAGEKPVYQRLPKGQYGLSGECKVKELSFERKEFNGRDGEQTHRWARIVVDCVHPELGKITVFGGGPFGKWNTNFASKTGSKWPAFASALGITPGMTKADAKAQCEGRNVVIDVDIREFENKEGEKQTENVLTAIQLA